jgi:molecular chaperone DnaJ
MPPKQDYYEALGVKKSAATDEIRKAYKRLARKFHPDLNPGDKAAEEHFKRIQEAYAILNDPKKRQMYDQVGFYSDNAQPGGGGGFHPGQGGGFGFDFGGFDFSDLASGGPGGRPGTEPPFNRGGGGFGDIFSQFFGGRGKREPEAKPENGADLEYALNIDFWQAIQGTQIKLKINRQSVCAACRGGGSSGGATADCRQCGGSGSVSQMAGAMRFNLTCPSCNGSGKLRNSCPACQGQGRILSTESVEVRIPPGAQSGSRLRVAGKWNAGTMGAPSGDLYITIRVDPHPFFERDGDNVLIEVPITVWEASLGTKIEVPTIDGRAILKIPQGTQNGQKFRLREKGVRNDRKNRRGDQIVRVSISAPPARDERTREILRELSTLHSEDPRAEIWNDVKGDDS